MAVYDILPTDDFYPDLFDINMEEFPPISQRYSDSGWETTSFIMLLGSMFLLFLWMFVKAFFWVLTAYRVFGRNRHLDKVLDFFVDGLFWTTPLEFIIEGYFPIAFAVSCSLENLQWDSYSCIGQSFMALFLGFFIIVLPFGLVWFLWSNKKDLANEELVKFGPAYQDLEDNEDLTKVEIFKPILFLVRRLLLVVTL